jgi:hypothetical protein
VPALLSAYHRHATRPRITPRTLPTPCPRTEHFAPLFVTLGAASGDLTSAQTVIDGFWFGLAKRSIQVA